MISKDYIINAQQGMHARPATALLKLTRQFNSLISLKKDNRVIPVKSMLNILSLALKQGDLVRVVIQGEDEIQAAQAVEVFFMQEINHL